MKEYIAKQIDQIGGIDDKILLKELLNNVFLGLHETCEEKYNHLERRIEEEIPLLSRQFSVYTTVMGRTKIDASHGYLASMDPKDLLTEDFPTKDLREAMNNAGKCRVLTAFYEADYCSCQKLLESDRIFNGSIKTQGEKIPARFMLKKAERYSECIYKLYSLFQANNVVWKTVNAPYLSKFFDVYLIDADGQNFTEDETVSFEIDFEEYQNNLRLDMIPVWNVRKLFVKADDFPMPVEDKINFEYRFDLARLGLDNGYLVDDAGMYVASAKRVDQQLRVVSPVERNIKWTIFTVVKRKDAATDQYEYPLMSNSPRNTFAERLACNYGMVIKTRAEVTRLMNSYALDEFVKYRSLKILDHPSASETYEMNSFIRDEIRMIGSRETLMFYFEEVAEKHFLNRDIISFLVSQMQLMFPEYVCAGAFV